MMHLLKILMIGNSFSICVGTDLPKIVASVPDCEIELTSAYIGGCPLRRHWANFEESAADPEKRQYKAATWIVRGDDREVKSESREASINELLAQGDWDIVTIQQASHESWDYANYQPFADNLVAEIRRLAPNARIWIQQTWAYRADDARLLDGGSWDFDQRGMHERVTAAYTQLAEHTGFPVIPTGRAVQIYRERETRPFTVPTTEELAALRPPDLPSQAGDVVGKYHGWKKNGDSGEMVIAKDTIHLNRRGEYLQACVWFQALYGRPLPEDSYIPGEIGRSDALNLRKCAADAVALGMNGKKGGAE